MSGTVFAAGHVGFDQLVCVGRVWAAADSSLSHTARAYNTRFAITNVAAARVGSDTVSHTAKVTNTGTTAGTEVVEAYVSDPASTGEPPEQLKAFRRIALQPGQSGTVHFRLDSSAFNYFKNGRWVVAQAPTPCP
jgi:beta-glucosidase